MPESADEHDDDQVHHGAGGPAAIPAERNVEIIAQESGKRNMPAAPEIGEPDGGVGEPEVVLEMEPEAEGGADRAGRVASEVEEDLPGKRDHADPGIERDKRTAVAKDAIRRTGKH